MNYRHHFHAGNFADAMKHLVLAQLWRALQGKEQGLLYLDTHAGRGVYDLEAAARGDSREREPEWPAGIGRLWAREDLPEAVADYVTLVRRFDRERGNASGEPRFFPGSPWIARLLARPQDRLALCEKHADECAALTDEFASSPRTTVEERDGYGALRAWLPPPERRALVLIDPPFETQDEFARIATALGEGLRRLRGGVFAVWYPLTERARVDAFFAELLALRPPPTLELELTIAGAQSPLKLRGCGLAVINPPWQFERVAESLLSFLGEALAQAPGGGGRVRWLVPET